MGFHGFLEVVIASNLGGPVGVVGGLGEVITFKNPIVPLRHCICLKQIHILQIQY